MSLSNSLVLLELVAAGKMFFWAFVKLNMFSSSYTVPFSYLEDCPDRKVDPKRFDLRSKSLEARFDFWMAPDKAGERLVLEIGTGTGSRIYGTKSSVAVHFNDVDRVEAEAGVKGPVGLRRSVVTAVQVLADVHPEVCVKDWS